jgi:hypothetical protein
MGNIHLIPTDNEQHSIVQKNTGLVLIQTPRKEYSGTKLNIYITSDEEIKEGDWYLYCNQINKRIRKNPKAEYPYPNYQKIILTTDQDLIKDGVQEIDNEFLEWFVKNPSCEFVEVQKWFDGLDFLEYKIIIPQEEPKQETLKEAAINNYPEGDVWTIEQALIRRLAFMNGSKWQAERSYSEEEVKSFLDRYRSQFRMDKNVDIKQSDFIQWFNKFKKK